MSAGPAERTSIRVLCVDDEPGLADLVARYLEREGADVEAVTATNASEGLERIASEPVDCVVSDYDMSGMNGQAFLEAVREDHPDLPFILFTGKGSEEVASEAISAGVTDYLQKGRGTDQYAVLAKRIENAVLQRRSAQQLERQNDLFEKVQEMADIGAWEYDVESGEAWLSEQAYRIHGLPPSFEPTPENWSEFYHPEDQPKMDAAIRRAVDSGEPYDLELRFDVDGERRWAHVRGEPIREDGAVRRIRATIQDVTEQKRRERRYRTLVENLPGIVYRARIEPDWPFEYLHGECESFTGYTAAELRDEVSWGDDVIHPDDRQRVYDEVVAAIGGGDDGGDGERGDDGGDGERGDDGGDGMGGEASTGDDSFELRYRIRTRDGEARWAWERGRLVEDGILEGFITDVTGRVEYEHELERYETIVEASGDGVYTIDADGRFTFVNDSLADMAGYEKADLRGEHVSIVMSDEDIERGQAVIRSLLSSSADRDTFEMGLRTADGDVVPCENHIAVLPTDDEFRGTVGVLRDVTERARRERALERQKDRLEEFASVVSHDLRNPLSLAQGYLERARETGDPEAFAQVEHGLDRIEHIIDDVLWLAQEGRGIGDTESVSVGDVVERAWRSVTADAPEADLVCDREALGTVTADRERLCQLLENLLSNAIEHAGPSVTVRAIPVEGGFALEDDGPGIPEADRDQVFERGFTSDAEGTGLGLHIVRDIAHAHGWEIAVVEGERGGARFEIRTEE